MSVQEPKLFSEKRDTSEYRNVTPEPASPTGLNYFKLYLTIVAGILTAYFIMWILAVVFSVAVLGSAFSAISERVSARNNTPTQQNSAPLQRDLQNLAKAKSSELAQEIARPQLERAKELNKQAQQKADAHKTNVQTCNFWTEQYAKEKTDRNKMHLNSSCSRAYGGLFSPIK